MARLVLVGLPGTGKTTLARALGERWGCAVIDTDDAVALVVGVPTAQYLRENGEVAFRQRELDALREALTSDAVVATGAGVVTTPEARELIAAQFTLWLDCDDDTLLARVEDGERPLLGDDHAAALRDLRQRRESWYRASARARVDSSGSLDEVAQQVLGTLESLRP
ncbi:MAG: Shikimate kinase [Acidimicrobiaceae bacterium]|nr:Shikimate kinase [Acidimicrobiaceae bacterium]